MPGRQDALPWAHGPQRGKLSGERPAWTPVSTGGPSLGHALYSGLGRHQAERRAPCGPPGGVTGSSPLAAHSLRAPCGPRIACALSRVTHTPCAPPTASCHGHHGPSRTLGADMPGPVSPRRARLGAVSTVPAAEVPASTHLSQPDHICRVPKRGPRCRYWGPEHQRLFSGGQLTHGNDRGWI